MTTKLSQLLKDQATKLDDLLLTDEVFEELDEQEGYEEFLRPARITNYPTYTSHFLLRVGRWVVYGAADACRKVDSWAVHRVWVRLPTQPKWVEIPLKELFPDRNVFDKLKAIAETLKKYKGKENLLLSRVV
jgi:hypothetical protein